MISFASDYLEGAHPKVLEALTKTNMIQAPGYGEDTIKQKKIFYFSTNCINRIEGNFL